MELPGKTKRGRPKRRFIDAVREDMAVVEVTGEQVRRRMQMENPLHGDPRRKKRKEEEE